jgi:hypothetical protein
MQWTTEQIEHAKRIISLDYPESGRLYNELSDAMGDRQAERLIDYVDKLAPAVEEPEAESPAANKPKRKRLFKQARRVSKHPETWRILKNYPTYEISSHGRVRSLNRIRPDDWLKPRRRWYKGLCVDSVVILDRDGKRCERFIGMLLVSAGFLPRQDWMDKKKEPQT